MGNYLYRSRILQNVLNPSLCCLKERKFPLILTIKLIPIKPGCPKFLPGGPHVVRWTYNRQAISAMYNIYNTGFRPYSTYYESSHRLVKIFCGPHLACGPDFGHARIKVIFYMPFFCAFFHQSTNIMRWWKNIFWNDPKIFCESDPLHFSFKTCVDQQFARKNLLQCESFFISSIFSQEKHLKIGENWRCNSIVLPI